jgi:hypothetical protein
LIKLIKILSILIVFNPSVFGNMKAIPFKMVNNLIIIEIDIETKTGNFILDTGSDAILLNSNYKLRSNKESTFQTVNGLTNTEETKISHLKIGDITKENISAYNTNLSNIENFLNLKIAGIIGADFFNPHSIFLDFESNVIKFYESAPDITLFNFSNHIDFQMIIGVPTTELKIGNQIYTFILDSGASIHLIDSKLMNKHRENFEKLQSSVKVESVGHSNSASKYIIKRFTINNTYLNDHTCLVKDFTDFNKKGEPEISGLLSISKLSEKGIMIDFHRMKIYF